MSPSPARVVTIAAPPVRDEAIASVHVLRAAAHSEPPAPPARPKAVTSWDELRAEADALHERGHVAGAADIGGFTRALREVCARADRSPAERGAVLSDVLSRLPPEIAAHVAARFVQLADDGAALRRLDRAALLVLRQLCQTLPTEFVSAALFRLDEELARRGALQLHEEQGTLAVIEADKKTAQAIRQGLSAKLSAPTARQLFSGVAWVTRPAIEAHTDPAVLLRQAVRALCATDERAATALVKAIREGNALVLEPSGLLVQPVNATAKALRLSERLVGTLRAVLEPRRPAGAPLKA